MRPPTGQHSLPLWDDASALGKQEVPQGLCDPARLTNWAPADWAVSTDWRPHVDSFLASPTGQRLARAIDERLRQGAVIYPPQPLRALALTPLSDVRVVILGQDPYHGAGQAEGLAFSVPEGIRMPPSLRNIHQEIAREWPQGSPAGNSLVCWAAQGVLLLNTCLTVEEGSPASHAKLGWEVLTDSLIQACSQDERPKVFMLWGAHAQTKAPLIDARRHLVLQANHPSPLSARRPPQPFIGCGHFGAANRWLSEKKQKEIDWGCNPQKTVA